MTVMLTREKENWLYPGFPLELKAYKQSQRVTKFSPLVLQQISRVLRQQSSEEESSPTSQHWGSCLPV